MAERQTPQRRGCHHDLHNTTQRHHAGGAHVAALAMHRSRRAPVWFFVALLSSPLLSAGRHQKRRIMCNYNRQSKTKPFTFNEFLLEEGRLPQGGILMKQMAECSQGQTHNVLFFTVCQHFQLSEGLHLSLDHSFICVSVCVKGVSLIDTSYKVERKKFWEYKLYHFLPPAACLQKEKRTIKNCVQCNNKTERKTPDRWTLYFILYRFISFIMCAYPQVGFDLTPFTVTQTTSHSYRVWCCCESAQCPLSTHSVTPYLYSSLIAFSHVVPVFNAEKIDIHWSIAKQSKYCPPRKIVCPQKKCWTSHCLRETKRLSLRVESPGLEHHVTKMMHSCAASK